MAANSSFYVVSLTKNFITALQEHLTRKLLEQNGTIWGLVNFKKCRGAYTSIPIWMALPSLHRYYYRQRFYCAKLLRSAVYAIVILSVCPFVCLSVTHWCTAPNLINVSLSWKSRMFFLSVTVGADDKTMVVLQSVLKAANVEREDTLFLLTSWVFGDPLDVIRQAVYVEMFAVEPRTLTLSEVRRARRTVLQHVR